MLHLFMVFYHKMVSSWKESLTKSEPLYPQVLSLCKRLFHLPLDPHLKGLSQVLLQVPRVGPVRKA